MTRGPVEIAAPESPADAKGVYFGTLKSYNDRRGFGFIACAETAAQFGRDVYMAKLEGQLAAQDLDLSPDSDPKASRLQEADLLCFSVKLSVEGFPQATQVRRLQKFHGTLTRSPQQDEESKPGRLISEDVASIFGGRGEVLVPQEACGHVRLMPGDQVSFCIPEDQELARDTEGEECHLLVAKIVMLESAASGMDGGVLGCCTLQLPRPGEGLQSSLACLGCHAFGSKVILAGVPMDLSESELMRFFSKQGASKAIVARAQGCSFASINFPSSREVSQFLSRSAHAYSDEKETHIAELTKCCQASSSAVRRLPALPAPAAEPGEVPGALLVSWTPLQLAVGYVVEIRPTGTKEQWAAVEVEAGRKGFEAPCSSCQVRSLRPGFAYEVRVTYYAACGCMSEASDASQPCVSRSSAPSPVAAQSLECLRGFPGAAHGCGVSPVNGMSLGTSFCPPPAGSEGSQAQIPLRCMHGNVVVPPAVPVLQHGDEAGFSVSVRWPAVAHVAAYVVELREAGSPIVERFFRSGDSAAPGCLVELRVGGLRPLPGHQYMAQVRCLTTCGCESAPSEPGYSPSLGLRTAPLHHAAVPVATGKSVLATDMSCSGSAASTLEVASADSKAAAEAQSEESPPEETGKECCLVLD
eukprot:TRINITY_DN15790_c0_g1_i1.p1 TRINITY_DN15790_c0_g1~~TRINITY_DN15790_c0_g1_i1.p1  ORF type:complete len:641 (+),score=138.40 TRINITY_DN15790_c0_g1_i1:85-2007(+)